MAAQRLPAIAVVAALLVGCGAPRPITTSEPSAPAPPRSSAASASVTATAPALDPELADRWLAFALDVDGASNVYVARASGAEQRRLTTGSEFRYNPSWAPDASRIAYRVEGPDGSSPDPERDGIWVVNADGTGNFSLSALSGVIGAGHSQPWSPDGTRIIVSGKKPGDQLRIWVMNADGSDPRPLTPTTYEAQYPAWSPDGETIAFAAVIDGGFRLMLMNADGSRIRQVTEGPSDNWPSWSPDGSQIAYGSGETLAVMNADGSDRRTITSELGVPATWAPGEVIAANCLVDGDIIGICAVGQDGTLTPLLSGIEAGFPAWRPAR